MTDAPPHARATGRGRTARSAWIVPGPAAGAGDVVSRITADRLQRALGQPVVIENRPGRHDQSRHAGGGPRPGGWLHAGGGSRRPPAMAPIAGCSAPCPSTRWRVVADQFADPARAGRGHHHAGLVRLVTPAGVAEPILARLHQATVESLRDPETAARLVQGGALPRPQTRAEFARFMAEQTEMLGALVRASGATLN